LLSISMPCSPMRCTSNPCASIHFLALEGKPLGKPGEGLTALLSSSLRCSSLRCRALRLRRKTPRQAPLDACRVALTDPFYAVRCTSVHFASFEGKAPRKALGEGFPRCSPVQWPAMPCVAIPCFALR
jgi:hypothetical protein